MNYPERSDEQMLKVEKKRNLVLDENYPYYNKSFGFKIKRSLSWLILYLFIFPIVSLNGCKIKGKENIKKNKKLFKDGAITICNHVLYWDYACVLKAIKPHLLYTVSWKEVIESKYGKIIRLAGGIPIPTDNIRAMAKFNKSICQILEEKKWLHFFPEGSLWYYYPDIRPLKKSIFKYSVKYNRPIIPMAISFRERKGLSKLTGKNPLPTLHIGEPILPDLSLPVDEAIDKMHKEAYHIMQGLVGIHPGDPRYNTNQDINTWKKR